ncbi:hypothetical protein FSP39_001223 [Pinctada imbricata]|uniref:Anoctamin n=1 Tax=Pinctada imbricata TaxID=66713 RepID=A0AA89BUJ1_PINIB|nr:hypothetical protein FSP39_001223 [Pinctada imbricata]
MASKDEDESKQRMLDLEEKTDEIGQPKSNGGSKPEELTIPTGGGGDADGIAEPQPVSQLLYCDDKKKRIDYVLAWTDKEDPEKQEISQNARRVFEKNLEKENLYLEYDKKLDETIFEKKDKIFTLTYTKDKDYLFEEDKEKYFDNASRSRIVNFILRRKPFSDDKTEAFSFGKHIYDICVNKMIKDGHYSDAYPLHEGHWKPGSVDNTRKRLFDYWANWRNFLKVQPLDHVRKYFGEKIAIYFTWLGFYTQMLIPASIVGLVVFFYGCGISGGSYPAKEVCDPNKNFTMCPLCDFQCPYWDLRASCSHVVISRIFDNGGTVFFAIFMSLWGTLFLEFWKRKQAKMQYLWDLTDFVKEEPPPRPEYLAQLENVTTYKEDPVTGMKEPHLPFWRKRVPIYLMSWSIMFFLAMLAVVAVVGVIAYRVSVLAALQIYSRLAFKLTDWECLRTQKDYDDSITLKLFALQFVNYYSSIFYIAFIKGRIVGRPGNYNTFFGARQEECEAGGCLIELCIQLAIIMTGKQLIVNNIMEIVIPKLIKLIKRKIFKISKEKKMNAPPWERDYRLESAQHTALFYEYLEMVLQFGFLTIFVAAFPLGPLFALINNILEIRFDAIKFITQLRRPLAQRLPDIGIWYSVLYGISRIAIMSNAFIIALTSDYIPRLVYVYAYSPDGTLVDYMERTLSKFNTSDFQGSNVNVAQGVEICRYRDFRKPPNDPDKYEYSEMYWHILAARLAFVVIFENLIVIVTGFISWLIPDVPGELKIHIRREAYITNEIIIKTELLRAQGEEIKPDTLRAIVEEENKKYHTGEGKGDGDPVEGLRYRTSATGSMNLETRKTPSPSPDEIV